MRSVEQRSPGSPLHCSSLTSRTFASHTHVHSSRSNSLVYRCWLKLGVIRPERTNDERKHVTVTQGPPAQSPTMGETPWKPGRLLRVIAWISFILNVTIIGTGGAVRLTGSGLGCTDWPLCTPGSLIPTPEQTYHALIEFGNRTISGPLLIAALLVLVLSWLVRKQRKDLVVLSAIVLFGVLLQAFVGGVIVWLHLDANLVGFHYVASVVLVCLTAAYLVRLYDQPGPRVLAVPRVYAILTHVATLLLAVTVFVGVLTTGAGPHSGDENVVRDGFDATLLSHIHAWPSYVLALAIVTLVAWAAANRLQTLPWMIVLLLLTAVQIVVGIYQARNGLPPFAVGVHMVLASLNAAAMTVTVLRLKKPVITL